jgi:chemotaxis signal transduction protein
MPALDAAKRTACLTFSVRDDEFAVDIGRVQDIRSATLNGGPFQPAEQATGYALWRGRPLPILRLGDADAHGLTGDPLFVIVVRAHAVSRSSRSIGLAADSVGSVRWLTCEAEGMSPALRDVARGASDSIAGFAAVGARMLAILNCDSFRETRARARCFASTEEERFSLGPIAVDQVKW